MDLWLIHPVGAGFLLGQIPQPLWAARLESERPMEGVSDCHSLDPWVLPICPTLTCLGEAKPRAHRSARRTTAHGRNTEVTAEGALPLLPARRPP